MGTSEKRLGETVLTSTHNLCFELKYDNYQNFFLSETFIFLVVKFSVYLNRHVFVMHFPDLNSNSSDNIWVAAVYEFIKKDTSGPHILALSGWNVKFPDISLTVLQNCIYSLTNHRIPCQFPDLEKIKCPRYYPDPYEPCFSPVLVMEKDMVCYMYICKCDFRPNIMFSM